MAELKKLHHKEISDMKAQHHSEVRQLKDELKEKDRFQKLYYKSQAKVRELMDEDSGLYQKMSSQIRDLKKQITDERSQHQKELEEKDGEIRQLKARINRNYTNSNNPSSRSPNHKTIHNSRQKTGRKPGGVRGHAGHRRLDLPADITVDVIPEPVGTDPGNWALLPGGKSKKSVGIQLKAVMTEYRL